MASVSAAASRGHSVLNWLLLLPAVLVVYDNIIADTELLQQQAKASFYSCTAR